MKRTHIARRVLTGVLTLALALTLPLPVSAFFWNKKTEAPIVADFAKNALWGETIHFTAEDFAVQGGSGDVTLAAITLCTLPAAGSGTLTMAGQPLSEGSVVDQSALAGLCFQSTQQPSPEQTQFSFTPTFSTGDTGPEATATLYLLQQSNLPPIAKNMSLSTYKNVAVTGYFDAVDNDGDPLTFQLTSTPARGAVTLAEDGSSQFVYTPYENKTGKDTFTYVAIDSAGNTSPEATVSLRIEKADTKVTYADMDGNPSHKSAIRLAEEGIFVGQYMDGQYFFDPAQTVSRAQFLTLAMSTVGLEPLENASVTGFSDDASIPTWAKGSICAALKAGAIRGSSGEDGAPVFDADAQITRGEASVMLNNLLNMADVPVDVFASSESTHWASQAAANLAAAGFTQSRTSAGLSDVLTRADAAQLLDDALAVLEQRQDSGWLPW